MSKIKILNEFVANQIAAGEVIERPVSVVKELIENALDANANQIDIFFENGGKSKLVVLDNGIGMSREDAALSFSRYATSKLTKLNDLFTISTYGFRGEALASIASVSKIELLTKEKKSIFSTKIKISNNKRILICRGSLLLGTRIEVSNLFFNMPARLKFLKSDRIESAAIENVVRIAALSKLFVGFRIFKHGKCVFNVKKISDSAGSNDAVCKQRIATCLAVNSRKYIFPIYEKTNIIEIKGYIVNPLITRRDKRGINIFVNNRFVKNKELSLAIKIAFRTLLEVGRFPIVSINLILDPFLIDINMHPQKLEVRFSRQSIVMSHLISLLSSFLSKTPWLKIEESTQSNQNNLTITKSNNLYNDEFVDDPKKLFYEKQKNIFDFANHINNKNDINIIKFSQLKIIGQIKNTFLVLEGKQEVLIIDQHAAHERVLFEKILLKNIEVNKYIQKILIPIQFIVNPEQMTALLEFKKKLNFLGFEIDVFGEHHAILKSIPLFLTIEKSEEIIKDILSDLAKVGRADFFKKLELNFFSKLACHLALKAGQKMHSLEINALLKELDVINYSSHCPHGRPAVKIISFKEMFSWFNRL